MTLHTGGRELLLESGRQLKALADRTRAKILRILEDGPRSAKQLSESMAMTHGKVGHHLKVLRDAGLVEVVREQPVRAVTERFYGLTYDRLTFSANRADRLAFLFEMAAREAAPAELQRFDPPGAFVTARLSEAQARDFHARLLALVAEFTGAADPDGDGVFGMVGAVFATDTPRPE